MCKAATALPPQQLTLAHQLASPTLLDYHLSGRHAKFWLVQVFKSHSIPPADACPLCGKGEGTQSRWEWLWRLVMDMPVPYLLSYERRKCGACRGARFAVC